MVMIAVLNFEIDGEKFQKVGEFVKDSNKANQICVGKEVFWLPKGQAEESTTFHSSEGTRKLIIEFAEENDITPQNILWYNVESWIAEKKELQKL